jgi:cytidylate kinase
MGNTGKHFSVAIDGPAGAGKSTIARALAGRLGFVYVDTGAMYRAMALHFLRKGLDMGDEAGICAACGEIEIGLPITQGGVGVLLNGEDVSGLIRTEEVGNASSASSVYPCVRAKLLELQRSLAKQADVIMDGRDIGTKVLPDADVKVFLTAGVSERARRRHKEYLEKGQERPLEEIERDIRERDARDCGRKEAPLRQAQDAVAVDSSDMTIGEVMERIIEIARGRGLHVPGDADSGGGTVAGSHQGVDDADRAGSDADVGCGTVTGPRPGQGAGR